ncbi:MAG: hypothetical protein OQJ87_09565, partial [Rhodospirillales bacterium]|nr:hypothetical protein [Rhodospirillales bacterium]
MTTTQTQDEYFFAAGGPFDLDDDDAYARWRDEKLADYPASAGDLVVEVNDPSKINDAEFAAMMALVRKTNMALYATVGGGVSTAPAEKETIRAVGARFGLHNLDSNLHADDDGITPLHIAAAEETGRLRYIPYSDRPIKWHTDGYYNLLDRQ